MSWISQKSNATSSQVQHMQSVNPNIYKVPNLFPQYTSPNSEAASFLSPTIDKWTSIYIGKEHCQRAISTKSVNQLVNYTYSVIKDQHIDFPWKRFRFKNDEINMMFQRINGFDFKWNTVPYDIVESQKSKQSHFEQTDFPHQFQRYNSVANTLDKPMHYNDTTSRHHYWDINVITDCDIEPSRVMAKRSCTRCESPYELWTSDEGFVKAVIKAAIFKFKSVSAHSLRESFYQVKGYQECPHERVLFIHNLYKLLFNDRRDVVIFDACAGYGDRMIAAIAYGAEQYLGVDPNSMSQPAFKEMSSKYTKLRIFSSPNPSHQIIEDYMPSASQGQASVVNGLLKHKANLVYLSPPSYDSETYSDDETQSTNMHKDEMTWTNEFLFATVDECVRQCDANGYLVIQSVLANRINCYIRVHHDEMVFLGAVSCQTDGNRNKPMWVWLKNSDVTSDLDVPSVDQCKKDIAKWVVSKA